MPGTLGDAASGATAGAAIGSAVPGLGTLLGGALGGLGGWLFGDDDDDNQKQKAFEAAQRRYAQLLPMMQDARMNQMGMLSHMYGPLNNALAGIGSDPIPLNFGNPFGGTMKIGPGGQLARGGPAGVPAALPTPRWVPGMK